MTLPGAVIVRRDRLPIDRQHAADRLKQTHDDVQKRALAASRSTHDAGTAALGDAERGVLKHPGRIGAVAKREIVEADRLPERQRCLGRQIRIGGERWIEQIERVLQRSLA